MVLLDVAKESSDVFPPLKSCLGGISALTKHYDVCSRRMMYLCFADRSLTANQGCEGQTRGPNPLGDQIEGQPDENPRRRRS